MSLKIYAIARNKFVTAAWSWPSLAVQARLFDASYVANLETDIHIPSGEIDSTTLTGKTTDAKGFCRCNPIFFNDVVNATPITQILVFASTGGIPIFHIDCPPINPSTVPRPVQVLLGGAGWLFRI
jgi:hypothetical protein